MSTTYLGFYDWYRNNTNLELKVKPKEEMTIKVYNKKLMCTLR